MPNTNPNVHEGHRKRMRERIALDPHMLNFNDHELLEILLGASIKRANTNEIAHRLLDRFGGLAGVFNAPIDELTNEDGVGESVATLLHIQGALLRAYMQDKYKVISSKFGEADLFQAVVSMFLGYPHEMIYCFCLDSKNRVISKHRLSDGISNRTNLDMTQLARIAILNNASSVMLAHNHPSGRLTPSNEDLMLTKAVSEKLEILGIRLAEHVIVAGTQVFQIMTSNAYCEFLRR